MKRQSAIAIGWGAVLLLVSAPLASAAPDGVRLAIAAFERVAPPGGNVPDFATLLADRIATRGVAHVVGPGEIGGTPTAEPDSATIKEWAKRVQVAAVVVGRTTRIGSQVSVDVRLRSGATGAVVGTYVTEVRHSDQLQAAVDRLASQLIDGTSALMAANSTAPVSASRSGARSGRSKKPKAQNNASPFGLASSLDSNQPLNIKSDQLEAVQKDGRRRLVFTDNVQVVQGDLTIRADRLEALYPEGSSQPSELIADGRVRLYQGGNEAHCDHLIYRRAKDQLVCRGNAELRDGPDRVRGREIHFDLATEKVTVIGGASVVIQPKKDAEQSGEDAE